MRSSGRRERASPGRRNRRSSSPRRCAHSQPGGPVTSAEALAHLESEYGLAGVDARRAWQTARLAAHIVQHHETALWQPRNEQRFVAIEEPEAARPGRGARRDLPPLPRGLRPFDAPRHRSLEHDPRGRDRRCAGAARAAAPLPRRAGSRAPRRPTSAAAGRRDPRARTLPAEVGQRPARLGRPHARAPGGLPEDGDQDERRRRADVPRRRLRRRDLARRRRPCRAGAVRASFAAARREIEDEAGRLEAFLAEP